MEGEAQVGFVVVHLAIRLLPVARKDQGKTVGANCPQIAAVSTFGRRELLLVRRFLFQEVYLPAPFSLKTLFSFSVLRVGFINFKRPAAFASYTSCRIQGHFTGPSPDKQHKFND